MGRKKGKGRCVRNNTNVLSEPEELVKAPHSFVIHRGQPGGWTSEITKDFRKVMEPFTATSLKERKKNTIKDFVSVAGYLHVSHMSIFSRTEVGTYLKMCKLPRGPTLTFKVHNFTLARDVVSALRKQNVADAAYKHAPLVVLNSFSGEGLHLKLMATTFQNMFPTINLTNVDLNTVRRCVLINYNPATKHIDFRHYIIKITPVGVSKGVKKVVQGKVPNLGRCNDISELLTRTAMLSESEAEDDPNNHVTLPQKIITRGNIESGKSSIRLTELGPRITLQLMKIEDGLLDGEVLYHDFITKTEKEKLEIQKSRDAKKKLKEKRKKLQETNQKNKEDIKQKLKEKSLRVMKRPEENVEEKEDDDAEYYREEVGQEPEKELFTQNRPAKRSSDRPHFVRAKKRKVDDNNQRRPKTNQKKRRMGFENRDRRPIGYNANKR